MRARYRSVRSLFGLRKKVAKADNCDKPICGLLANCGVASPSRPSAAVQHCNSICEAEFGVCTLLPGNTLILSKLH